MSTQTQHYSTSIKAIRGAFLGLIEAPFFVPEELESDRYIYDGLLTCLPQEQSKLKLTIDGGIIHQKVQFFCSGWRKVYAFFI